VVIGSDGFGYAQHDGEHVKLNHVGRVVVEDDVEIGANTTIDRALLDETRIGAGSKLDNLVQVGHNVTLGRGCLLVSQAGISGSTRLGDGVVVAGQSGLSGHLKLGDGVQVAAKSAVFKSVDAGKKVAGIPATDASSWLRQQAMVARLVELGRRVAALERSAERGEQENES
jgi:UDP-3-O-[3-hydroxymyristoyl] glucosamine N-acyltransferase